MAIRHMLIPNPVSENTKFFNEVLLQLFNNVYDAISVVQFKDYVSAQRIHRWKLLTQRKAVHTTFKDLTSHASKNGNSINVRKYTDDNSSFTKHDVKTGSLEK